MGRVTEQQELAELLLRVRLLTLTGPAGVGKSRLAARVAQRVSGLADGVVAVDVARASDEVELGQLLSGALDRDPDADLQATIGDLGDAELLLVFDNCEHLLDACAELILALIVSRPRLRILVSSREALRTVGERTWTVAPLPVPGESAPYADIMASDAVALFVARAREIDSTFAVDPLNAAAIAAICRRVDGLPLALELAAERTSVLTVGQIESELATSFAVLDGRSAARLHQQTLGANLDRSIRLLDERQQRLFRRLSVFEGDWTLEAARQVCANDDLPADDILPVLGELVSKSLVQSRPSNGATRFSMLRITREFAVRLLESAGETETLHRRHAQWCASLAEDSPPPHPVAPGSMQAGLDAAAELLGPEQPGDDLADELPTILTPREREVARLLVAGSTTRQIADALVISGATARAHLEHIRTKLGAATRRDVAARLVFESTLSTP